MSRVITGRYALLELIGSGGMGSVWRAHDRTLDREVAIKEILVPPGPDRSVREHMYARTFREARSAARLDHPNIVTVYDVVEEDGRPWIVMQLVRARGLDKVIETEGPLEPVRAAAIGLQILDALGAAHAAGVIHRDVKPANVLLAGDKAVLTDFGIASLAGDTTLTSSGTIIGSPAFLAPEQAQHHRVTPASDLWSLGATLYAAVEGRPPYQRPDVWGLMAALVSAEPDPPQRAGVLRPVLDGLLRKDPAWRLTTDQVAPLLQSIAASRTPAFLPGATPPPHDTAQLPQGTMPLPDNTTSPPHDTARLPNGTPPPYGTMPPPDTARLPHDTAQPFHGAAPPASGTAPPRAAYGGPPPAFPPPVFVSYRRTGRTRAVIAAAILGITGLPVAMIVVQTKILGGTTGSHRSALGGGSSPSSSSEPTGSESYRGETFQAQIPRAWKIIGEGDGVTFEYYRNFDYDNRRTIRVQRIETYVITAKLKLTTPKEGLAGQLKNLRSGIEFPQFNALATTEPQFLNGAEEVEFTFRRSESTTRIDGHGRVRVFKLGKRLYTVTQSTTEKDWPGTQPIFDTFFTTFHTN